MATIKSFTDITQSKKLAEILPLESADMVYVHTTDLEGDEHYDIDFRRNQPLFEDDVCAWSLVALLSVLPMITKGKENANPFITKTPDNEYYVVYATLTKEVDCSGIYDNPVDACVDMIEKLNELKIL